MRPILIILMLTLVTLSAKSQSTKWQPGRFTDNKGKSDSGQIRVNPPGHGPIRNEGYIAFRENKHANPFVLSASDLNSFITGRDSFVVAREPLNEAWSANEYDFVKVVVNDDVKLYEARVNNGNRTGVGFGPEVGVGVGTGFGGGGFGSSIGGGISIPLNLIFGGNKEVHVYYYGPDPTQIRAVTNQNFEDVMSDIMGDYPELVEKIHQRKYGPGNIDKLIADYYKLKTGK